MRSRRFGAKEQSNKQERPALAPAATRGSRTAAPAAPGRETCPPPPPRAGPPRPEEAPLWPCRPAAVGAPGTASAPEPTQPRRFGEPSVRLQTPELRSPRQLVRCANSRGNPEPAVAYVATRDIGFGLVRPQLCSGTIARSLAAVLWFVLCPEWSPAIPEHHISVWPAQFQQMRWDLPREQRPDSQRAPPCDHTPGTTNMDSFPALST